MAAVGPNAFRFAVGDRVMALLGGGGHAELAVVHERLALPVPEALDWPAAGGFVEVFATAHDALFTQARARAGRAAARERRRGRRRAWRRCSSASRPARA